MYIQLGRESYVREVFESRGETNPSNEKDVGSVLQPRRG
jgi:hypothetical protein